MDDVTLGSRAFQDISDVLAFTKFKMCIFFSLGVGVGRSPAGRAEAGVKQATNIPGRRSPCHVAPAAGHERQRCAPSLCTLAVHRRGAPAASTVPAQGAGGARQAGGGGGFGVPRRRAGTDRYTAQEGQAHGARAPDAAAGRGQLPRVRHAQNPPLHGLWDGSPEACW